MNILVTSTVDVYRRVGKDIFIETPKKKEPFKGTTKDLWPVTYSIKSLQGFSYSYFDFFFLFFTFRKNLWTLISDYHLVLTKKITSSQKKRVISMNCHPYLLSQLSLDSLLQGRKMTFPRCGRYPYHMSLTHQ